MLLCNGDHCSDSACVWNASLIVFGPIVGILLAALLAYIGGMMYRQGPVVYLRYDMNARRTFILVKLLRRRAWEDGGRFKKNT